MDGVEMALQLPTFHKLSLAMVTLEVFDPIMIALNVASLV